MRFDLDDYLGVFTKTVSLRSARAEVLAHNLANADTPGFKARDFDFKKLLSQSQSELQASRLKTSHSKHLSGVGPVSAQELLYRSPIQASVDGNTVDTQIEKSEFIENAIRYQASLSFLGGRIKSLRTALKGE